MGNGKKEKFGTLGKMETEKWENGKSWKNEKWKVGNWRKKNHLK